MTRPLAKVLEDAVDRLERGPSTPETSGPPEASPVQQSARLGVCLDAVWLALVEQHGTEALDKILAQAIWYAELASEGKPSGPRKALAQDYALKLYHGGHSHAR